MAGEWSAIFKVIGSLFLRWLPGWILGRAYPIRKCQEQLIVQSCGVGPHIYVNAGRAPVILGLNLSLMNRLPFAVKIDGLHLELNLESQKLTNHDPFIRETLGYNEMRKLTISDIQLSDRQAEMVQKYQTESPILRISGYISCGSVIGEFRKQIQLETRSFVYCGIDSRESTTFHHGKDGDSS